MRKAAGAHHAYLVRHFERRRKAAQSGLHLPSEDELLLGMGFFCGEIFEDAKETCNRWLNRLQNERLDSELPDILKFIEAVTVAPDPTSILLLSNVLFDKLYDAAGSRKEGGNDRLIEGLHMRCRIYLAHLDMPGAARDVAFEAVKRFSQTEREYYKYSIHFAYSALAWAIYALNWEGRQRTAHQGGWSPGSPIQQNSISWLVVEEMIDEGVQGRLQDEKSDQEASRPELLEENDFANAPTIEAEGNFRIVLREVGNPDITEGKKVASAFRSICSIPLPLVALPDLVMVQNELNNEAPHAHAITREILGGLIGQRHIHLAPTILVGETGCGKTRYARRLFELLGVKHQIISCGGVADGNWGGTARRWSTGEPSLPLSALLRTKIANPGLILDEVEKVGTDRHNGNAAESILAMLEPETAERFVDPYVQGECDISSVSWVMTANELRGVHGPFRDRCRVLRLPSPGPEHCRHFAERLLVEQMRARGLDSRWFTPLDHDELRYIEKLWRGGSIRRLQKIVQGVVRARMLGYTVH